MRDRVPTPGRENRVKITQDDGTVVSGVLEYDDQATQEGSPYTKGNVLPDDVCQLMSLDVISSEPDDAFRYLALMQADVYGKIVVTVTSNGLPLEGVVFTLASNTLTTDANGKASLILPPGNYTAKFTNTLDLSFSPTSLSVTSTKGKINYYTAEATEKSNNQAVITSSQTFRFSQRVKEFDVFCVGGGGGGAAATMIYDLQTRGAVAATGGASGYTATTLNQTYDSSKDISVTIGAGGAAVSATQTVSTDNNGELNSQRVVQTDGNSGGVTSVLYDGTAICTANGGGGGKASSRTTTGSFGLFYGAKGGNGSAAAAGDAPQNGSSWGSYEWIRSYCGTYGENDPYYFNVEDEKYTNTGYSQGHTNRAFEEDSGARYGIPGQSCAASRNNGTFTRYSSGSSIGAALSVYTNGTSSVSATAANGSGYGDGGGAAGALSRTDDTMFKDYTATANAGAGKKGCVIIRWRYN